MAARARCWGGGWVSEGHPHPLPSQSLPPSKARSAEEAAECQKQVHQHTLTLKEFHSWSPWSCLFPWRIGLESSNLETRAGITDFVVFHLTLGR